MSPFEVAVAAIIKSEGGYTANPADPGNWTGGQQGNGELRGTKFGISAAAYPKLDIRSLTLEDAQAIYRRDYWDRISGDNLPPPLALLVFDAAVNSGVARAVGWLQQCVGVHPDGMVGPQTLAAVGAFVEQQGDAGICTEFMTQRLIFLASLPTWRAFGIGWTRRLFRLPFEVMDLEGTKMNSARVS